MFQMLIVNCSSRIIVFHRSTQFIIIIIKNTILYKYIFLWYGLFEKTCYTVAMIQEKAYAKLNLTLGVLFKRQDGYHALDTLMTTVSLWEEKINQ